jgi:hypothetical protein
MFPDLMEKVIGAENYTAKLFGFRVFGKKGSKFEYKYDEKGNVTNKSEIDKIRNTIIVDPDIYGLKEIENDSKSISKDVEISNCAMKKA